jgi:predicted small lipoprotein YifL
VRGLIAALLLLALAGCGGGGETTAPPAGGGAPGQVIQTSLKSGFTGFEYPIYIYLPASYGAGSATYPVIYATEGDAPYGAGSGSGANLLDRSRFNAFKEAMQRRNTQAILVGIGGTARRGTDFLLPGAAAYTNFIAKELAPAIESQYRADPKRRALSGLSHGGYYVVAALVLEGTQGPLSFSHYLSTESSFGGHGNLAGFLEYERQLDVGAARALPATLFLTGAPGFNLPIANAVYQQMTSHAHPGLALVRAEYATSHVGADLPAFEEALARFFAD